jgi:Phage portal protein
MANRWTRRLASGYRAPPPGPQVGGPGLPGYGAGLGMSVNAQGTNTPVPPRSKVKAATAPIRFVAPGQPMYSEWNARYAVDHGYMGQTHVMRCTRIRAETLAGLPFRAGPDPDDPSNYDPNAPLAVMLGEASPQAPGGPNPQTTARAFWIWSWVQRIITGKMCWEITRQTNDPQSPPMWLWPLVSAALHPIPSVAGSTRWFDSYSYFTPIGRIPLTYEQVFYDWRMSARDPRQPESVLQSTTVPIEVVIGVERYMLGLVTQGMVATTLVVAPDFEEEASRRAWEEQFNAAFTGYDNAGKVLFAYADNEYGADGKLVDAANIAVEKLAMTSADAQLMDMYKQMFTNIEIALGVPESLIGNASQRIYANADAEYRNFWTTTMINDVSEAQDAVNQWLAPQVDPDQVGWFDLSQVTALQPPSVFAPPQVTDMLNEGVISPEDVIRILNLGAIESGGEDVQTAPIGEESASIGAGAAPGGGRSATVGRHPGAGYRRVHDGMRIADNMFVRRLPLTTRTIRSGVWRIDRRRETATVVDVRSTPRAEPHPVATDVLALAESVRSRRAAPRTVDAATVVDGTVDDDWFAANNSRLLEAVEGL